MQEFEQVSGWQSLAESGGVCTEFESSGSGLVTKLNKLSNNLSVLKTSTDSPDSVFTGVNYPLTSSLREIVYADDRGCCQCKGEGMHIYDKPTGVPCSAAGCPACGYPIRGINAFVGSKFGAGCQHIGTTVKLHFVFRVDGNANVEVYYTPNDGDWPGPVFSANYSQATTYEETIDVSSYASKGQFCRIKIRASGSGELKVQSLLVFAEDGFSPELTYWSHGRGLDYNQLNAIGTRLIALYTPGKLLSYLNPPIRMLTTRGYRLFAFRRRGWRYLHYKPYTSDDSDDTPVLDYPTPGDKWGKYNLSKGDGSGQWDSIDLEKIDMLYYGMIYDVNDAYAAQEWSDKLD